MKVQHSGRQQAQRVKRSVNAHRARIATGTGVHLDKRKEDRALLFLTVAGFSLTAGPSGAYRDRNVENGIP